MKGLLFTYLLTYGGSAVALVSPFYGLLVYVCFAVISPPSLWFWAVPPGNYSRIVAIAMLVGWAARGFGNWHFGRARGIVFAFVGFWCWSAVSAVVVAQNLPRAVAFLELQAKILLPFLVGMTTIRSVAQVKALAWVLMVSQGYVAYDLNVSYLTGFNRLYFAGFGGMDNNCVAIAMVAGTGLAFFLGLSARRLWQIGLCVLAALLMVHCVMFAFSRGGMLALCVTAGIAFLLIPKRPVHYLIFVLVVMASLQMAGPQVRERFLMTFADGETRDASAQSRLDMWRDCLDVMQSNPILGVGPHHWPLIAPAYGWPWGKEAHTLWLQIGAELGVVGLALLLFFYSRCVQALWTVTRMRTFAADAWLRDAARMTIASLVGFAVAAQFVSLWALEYPYYVALLGAATLKLHSTALLSEPVTVPLAQSPAGPTLSPGYAHS